MRAYAFLNVSEPWIAWLVARGVIASARSVHNQALSVWLAKYLRDSALIGKRDHYFEAESRLEAVRQSSAPNSVSRLTGLYMFPDIATARSVGARWDGHFKEEYLSELEILSPALVSEHDSEFITYDFLTADMSWMSRYWSGVSRGAVPTLELLVEGRARVLNEQLIRQAFRIVEHVWPSAVSLLHLARAAAELGSDLGVVVPMLLTQGTQLRLVFAMNFVDAKNPHFLERLGNYRGQADLSLLAQSDYFNTPDFERYAVSIPNDA